MNHDKQKPIPQNELDILKSNAIGYKIKPILYYPNNNKHLEAVLDIQTGFDVVYNADSFILKYDENGEGIPQTENKWAVLRNYDLRGFDLFKHNEEFDNVDDAVRYAYLVYEQQLRHKLEKVNDILDKINRKGDD